MKPLQLFFFIALAFTLTTNAQITKGNWMFGGSGSYTYRNIDTGVGGSKTSVLTIKPNAGYFIKDKFVIGSSMSYYKYKTLQGIGSYVKNYGAGLFSRYYFLKTENTINIFSQVHFEKIFYEHNAGGTVNTGNGYIYGAKLGQVVFLNSSVGLEFSVGYEKTITGQDFTEDIIIGIGFQIHLEK